MKKEITLTAEEYNEAVHKVIIKNTEDSNVKKMHDGGLMVHLIGLMFANDLEKELFKESENE